MLHEIFKGMDNAAEVINENFQKGSIVDHNLDNSTLEEGFYVRFGNGFQFVFKSVLIDQNIGQNGVPIRETYPKPFLITPFGNFSVATSGATWNNISGFRNVVFSTELETFTLRSSESTFVNPNQRIIVGAFGIYDTTVNN